MWLQALMVAAMAANHITVTSGLAKGLCQHLCDDARTCIESINILSYGRSDWYRALQADFWNSITCPEAQSALNALKVLAIVSTLIHFNPEGTAADMWVSGFKYMIFLGNGFLRYGLVSSGQPKFLFSLQSCF